MGILTCSNVFRAGGSLDVRAWSKCERKLLIWIKGTQLMEGNACMSLLKVPYIVSMQS